MCLEICMQDNDALFEWLQHRNSLILWRILMITKQRSCAASNAVAVQRGLGMLPPASNFCGYGQWADLQKWGNLYRFPLLATLWQVLFRHLIRTPFSNSLAEGFRETGGPLLLCFEIGSKWEYARILNELLRMGRFTTWQAVQSGTTLPLYKFASSVNRALFTCLRKFCSA